MDSQATQAKTIVKVCVRSPQMMVFDYLADAKYEWRPGVRVRVPFGKSTRVGVVVAVTDKSDFDSSRLKSVATVLDAQPLLSKKILQLYEWISRYYHHPIGEVVLNAFPKLLRQGQSAEIVETIKYKVIAQSQGYYETVLKRAKKQKLLYEFILSIEAGCIYTDILKQGFSKTELSKLLEKNMVESIHVKLTDKTAIAPYDIVLNEEQQNVVTAIKAEKGFAVFLLQGVTGSGKTEVYFRVIEDCMNKDKQALVLVPEISLTPQTVSRFTERFGVDIALLHSNLTDTERAQAWLKSATGAARIIIGTRSAVLTPMPELGAIVLDEEHDTSFKQQSGLRYSARDVAIKRGHLENVPVILGSATPSLESLYNAQKARYHHLYLHHRISTAGKLNYCLIDLRNQHLKAGLSTKLLDKMREHLANEGQVLLFLNRRGYAPVLMCHSCGWIAECERCDARMTWHRQRNKLICHHCCTEHRAPRICGDCHQEEVAGVGVGTQRLEDVLTENFPDEVVVRIDRDSTRKKGELNALLDAVHKQHANIVIGTQMIAKGHHFEKLSMVAIVDADVGMFNTDFRSIERMGQLLIQVAGRAGRQSKKGEVIIQTHRPDDVLLQTLLQKGYDKFSTALLKEREIAALPPFTYLVLLRAEAFQQSLPMAFLLAIKTTLQKYASKDLELLGPISAPMEKRAGRFRAQLLFRSCERSKLQSLLTLLDQEIKKSKLSRQVRWSLDIDPQEML